MIEDIFSPAIIRYPGIEMLLPAHDIKIAGLTGEFCDMHCPVPAFVKSSQHAGTGRIAFGHVIEGSESNAFPGQAVNIGCPDLASIACDAISEMPISSAMMRTILGLGGGFPEQENNEKIAVSIRTDFR